MTRFGLYFLTSKADSDITTIHLPKELAERIRRRLDKSDFKNMDDYVAYVLDQILDEIEGIKSPKTEEVFSKKEQGDVEEHLRSLGYM
jgi:Arc/MetJ-type ribon-helix-helix transcriptional regulator